MGMFDISGTGSGKPMYAKDLYGAGQNMFADQMAPGIKRMTGYESPKRKAMAIADKADTTNLQSIKDTHRQLQQVNPTAASAWMKEALDIYNAQTQALSAQASYVNATGKKAQDRKIVAQNGVQYYADTGERVLPKVADKAPTPPTPSPVAQATQVSLDAVGILVNQEFDFGLWDVSGIEPVFTKKNIELSKEKLTDFVYTYSNKNKVDAGSVIQGIIAGLIDPTKPVEDVAAPVSFNNPYPTNNNSRNLTPNATPVNK